MGRTRQYCAVCVASPCSIRPEKHDVSEEDFWESEEQEILQDISEMENYDTEAERNAWNIGTDGTSDSQKIQNRAEIKKQFPVEDICTTKKAKRAENPMLKTMCYKADEQSEMCRIVQPILKEMCHMAYPELKEMCRTVSAEQDNKGKEFIARSCIYSNIVVVGKRQRIQYLVEELREMQIILHFLLQW